jgi:hypothetical protein
MTALYAQSLSTLTINGQLTDLDNNPIGISSPDSLNVSVSIFNQSAGGSPLYTETFSRANTHPVIIDKGYFNIALGTVQPVTALQSVLRSSNNLWVEVVVDNDTLSRAPVTGSPYVIVPSTPLTTASAQSQGSK